MRCDVDYEATCDHDTAQNSDNDYGNYDVNKPVSGRSIVSSFLKGRSTNRSPAYNKKNNGDKVDNSANCTYDWNKRKNDSDSVKEKGCSKIADAFAGLVSCLAWIAK